MKLVWTTLGVTLGTVFFVVADEPKPAPRPAPSSADQKEKPRILTLETPAIPTQPPGTTLAPGPRENTGPTIKINDNQAPLAPGIYVASPYTGIVVVPAPMDAGIFRPEPPNASKMPTAAPELKLTPRTK